MKHGCLFLIAALITIVLSSCNEIALENRDDWLNTGNDFQPQPTPDYCQENPNDINCKIIGIDSVTASFQQANVPRKVDIIWVIDNSRSMDDKQEKLAENFSSFIDQFVLSGSDFRIGITTTDAVRSQKQRSGELKDMGACGNFIVNKDSNLPYAPIIDSTMTIKEIKDQFSKNVRVGVNGSFDESGLKGALLALENSNNPSSSNYGFLRDDASLAIIIVSDENDISTDDEILPEKKSDINYRSVGSYVDAYKSFKQYKPDQVTIYSIVDTTETSEYLHVTSHYFGGSRYMKASELTGGFSINIKENFANALLVVGKSITTKNNKFHIGETPIAGSMKVVLNGIEIPNVPENGWYFDEASKSIFLTGSYTPDIDDVIEVSYEKYLYNHGLLQKH